MPSIIYIRPPASPVRKMPRSVNMSIVEPSPWACIKCRKRAITYADGVVWCNTCGHKLHETERVNISRGKQRNTPSPVFTKIKT